MKRFITSDDIYEMLREGKNELILGEEDQMTDIVREIVRRRGIRVIRGSNTPSVEVDYSGNRPSSIPAPATVSYGSSECDLVILNGTVVLPEAGRCELNVCVKDGVVSALTTDRPAAKQVIDARGKYVFPGIIDPHTHLGLYAPLETELETETRSAVLGGVTTIGTFFNHKGSYLPTIRSLENQVRQYSRVDLIPHFTLREEAQIEELPMYSARGMNSFKVYMCGVKGLYPHQEDGFILKAMEKMKTLLSDPVLCIHAENTSIVDYATEDASNSPVTNLEDWAQTHPNIAEGEAVVRSAYLGQKTQVRTYVVHNSCKESMEALRKVKHDRFYVETTSPYLTLDTSSDVGAYGKMLPPFREPESRLALWQGIREGLIDTIGTDNVTMTAAEKKFSRGMDGADAGYPALGTHLVSVLDEGFFRQEIPLEMLIPMMTMNPAKIFGVYPRKGTLLPGADADIVVVAMDQIRRVNPKELLSRSDFSLFQGKALRGWPVYTIKGGRVVAANGRLVDDTVRGAVLKH